MKLIDNYLSFTEKWGQDRITKTAGTLSLVFKDLKKTDIVQTLKGTTMTIAKKADAKQAVVIDGWNASTHFIVFGDTMKSFDKWLSATKPTDAQTSAARTEVWKKAGLLAG
ncbi:MAG: hypothetical protein K6E40_17085 [Desulfovibrio sp.]|nr:hypothetical protein [Desulfovibrio sp.]